MSATVSDVRTVEIGDKKWAVCDIDGFRVKAKLHDNGKMTCHTDCAFYIKAVTDDGHLDMATCELDANDSESLGLTPGHKCPLEAKDE